MSKKFRRLWVFGDSYSTPNFCVEPQSSFWGLVANYYNISEIINLSRPTNSFDTVSHLLVSMQHEYDIVNDLLLIGIPPLERITIFDQFANTPYIGHHYTDWNLENFDVLCHRGLVSEGFFGKDKFLVTHSDRSYLEIQTLRIIFFITTWLDSINANYLILNLGKPFDSSSEWPPANFAIEYTKQHPRCIVFDNTYFSVNLNINLPVDYDKASWHGHHGAEGNRRYFEFSILPKLKELC